MRHFIEKLACWRRRREIASISSRGKPATVPYTKNLSLIYMSREYSLADGTKENVCSVAYYEESNRISKDGRWQNPNSVIGYICHKNASI